MFLKTWNILSHTHYPFSFLYSALPSPQYHTQTLAWPWGSHCKLITTEKLETREFNHATYCSQHFLSHPCLSFSPQFSSTAGGMLLCQSLARAMLEICNFPCFLVLDNSNNNPICWNTGQETNWRHYERLLWDHVDARTKNQQRKQLILVLT